ncbi:YncE family protein [Clostridium sp.]|uniref:YncE family protein n=1 Tax=Clostridium sp. TaxID=1506 RepID=UPI0025BF946B|nr:YncE family protein [Clostridium sp.]
MNAINKNTFYVSNIGTNKISIINGENLSIIDEIKVGPRPFEIDLDNKNKIYIATDRNDKVTIVDSTTKEIKNLHIPNNGHIKVDSISEKIYVSNTEEVYIYGLKEDRLINKISGFVAVNSIEINRDGSKLFVLDIFQNEIKIYDTVSLRLLRSYKNIGENPNCFCIGEEERYVYIGNKSISKLGLNGNIVVIDLNSDEISHISFPKGSDVTDIKERLGILYIVNSGLNRLEIIDTSKNSIIGSLKTSLSKPRKIKALKDQTLLLATSKDKDGRGALDLIDIYNKKILNTLMFKDKDSNPYDVVAIQKETYKNEDILSSTMTNIEEKKGELILANKVLSTYKEKIIFQQEKVEIINGDKITIEEIRFENCKIIEESKNKEFISNKEDYIILNFEFLIPYYIKYIDSNKEILNIKGNLRGKQKAVLYISKEESDDLDFIVKSSSKIMAFPYISSNFIIFDVSSIISTYVIKEELIFIPSNEINNSLKEV